MSCGDLGRMIQASINRRTNTLILAALVAGSLLLYSQLPHFGALAWIVIGVTLPFLIWRRMRYPGLPLVCIVALQTFAIFAVPILTQNPSLELYSSEEVYQAGVEIFLFCASLALSWRFAFGADRPARVPRTYLTISRIDLENPKNLSRISLSILNLNAVYQLALTTGALDTVLESLPLGIYPIIRTLIEAATLGGCILGAYAIGTGSMVQGRRSAFWLLVAIDCLLNASSILLSTTSGVIIAVSLGYALGARRPPWLFLLSAFAALSFLNLSKFEMRAKYWDDYGFKEKLTLSTLPTFYIEWTSYSLNIITFNRNISTQDKELGQKLTDRLNNLQNLLFAQSAIEHQNLPLLKGETYTLIPKLLIPRFLWPEKPRTHEGQVLLNVHFGRQSLDASFTTYIAWGLLAEAYGNFGALWGPLFCGFVLGALISRLERWIRPYPITSVQSFVFLILSVNISLSFEMVASVWVTSIFQMLIALAASIAPFATQRAIQPGTVT